LTDAKKNDISNGLMWQLKIELLLVSGFFLIIAKAKGKNLKKGIFFNYK